MTKKKKKLTPNQIEYNKQVRRIKQFIYRAEKRGFVFEQNIIPEKPKRVTKKAIQRLKELKPDVLYSKAEYVSRETGELISGQTGRQIERKQAAQKSAQTRKIKKSTPKSKHVDPVNEIPTPEPQAPTITLPTGQQIGGTAPADFMDRLIISNWRSAVTEFMNSRFTNIMLSWLNKILDEHTEHEVATMLEASATAGYTINWEVMYKRAAMISYLAAVINFLPNTNEFFKEELMDAVEEMEDFDW